MEHTSREFERELSTLRDRLVAMGGRAEAQIKRALEAFLRHDDALADRVIAADSTVDQDEVEIDELAFLILAKRQPVASDLRFVMLALKIVTDLERIGDLAVSIARRERELEAPIDASSGPSFGADLQEMARRVQQALRQVLDAFVNADPITAENVIRDDNEIDHLNSEIISDLVAREPEGRQDNSRLLALSSISRYLERIGDHATNIAEMIIYYVRGRDVRHHPDPV